MAKLHRRRLDGRASGNSSRHKSRPEPVRNSARSARRQWSEFFPNIQFRKLVPGTSVLINLAVIVCGIWCLYWGTLWVQNILAHPSSPREESVAVEEVPDFQPVPEGVRIRVEVLNGCGVKGIAGELTEKLREQNFDVVSEGNYKSNGRITWNIRETIVIDRIGIPGHAQRVAAFMGTTNMIQQARSDSLLDVSIILGRDYQNLEAFR